MAVSFVGEGNWRKQSHRPVTGQIHFYRVHRRGV